MSNAAPRPVVAINIPVTLILIPSYGLITLIIIYSGRDPKVNQSKIIKSAYT